MKKLLIKKPGQMMLLIILLITVILIFTAAFFGRLTNYIHFGATTVAKEQAVSAAEAGIDYALWQLNQTAGSFNPSPTPTPLGTTGKFTVAITTKSAILKSITSTGCVPDCDKPRAKRTIKVDAVVDTEIIAFNYAIQTGSGGINSMTGGSTVNGNVWAGYKNGPVVDIVGSGNSVINGEAYATGTISPAPGLSVNPEPGNRHPNQDPATAPDLPTFNYQDWRTAAGTTACWGTDTISGQVISLGPCKQTGNLTITSGSIVNVTGPIWVTGNLTISGTGTKLKLDDAFGSNETIVLVDPGTITINGNAEVIKNGTSPGGYILLATANTADADCAASQAMNISGGTQTGIFYVLDGRACLSGGVHLTGLVAKTVSLSGGSTLDYDIGLALSSLTGGPGGSWQIKKGTYLFK